MSFELVQEPTYQRLQPFQLRSSKCALNRPLVLSQLQQGIRVELEHTSDFATAKEIALDHLGERPDYYEQLAKIEEHKKGVRARKYNKKPKNEGRYRSFFYCAKT